MSVAYRETNTSHLRFDQLRQKAAQAKDLEATLNPPRGMERVHQLGNVPAARARLRALKRTLESGAPRPYAPSERDLAVARRRELEDEIRKGMPTSVEMRRNLPDSVRKHSEWEKRAKALVWEWKAIGRRLHATEAGNGDLEPSGYEQNVETLRPIGSANVDTAGAQIPGRTFLMPDTNEPATVLTDDELRWLLENDRALAMRTSTMTNGERAELKRIIALAGGQPVKAAAKPAEPRAARPAKPAKAPPTEKQLAARKAAGERMRAMQAAKRAAAKTPAETDEQAA